MKKSIVKISEGLGDFSGFMKATAFASTDYMTTLLNPFTKGSNIDAAALAYQTTFDEKMSGGGGGEGSKTTQKSIKGTSNRGQQEIRNISNKELEEAQKESLALQGGPPGTVIMDNSVTKGGDVATSSATYQAEVAIDHSDRTAMLASLNQMIVN